MNSAAIEMAIENDWVGGKFEETETDYTIADRNILYKNEIKFLPKGVELLCKKLKPKSVLEFGFGMGWTATEFQKQGVQRHVILEPNITNYQMALEWKDSHSTDIDILNIFSWQYAYTEEFDLIYDDRLPISEESEELHWSKMEEVIKDDQWLSRNAGEFASDIKNISGHPIPFAVNDTNYVQCLIKGLYGNG